MGGRSAHALSLDNHPGVPFRAQNRLRGPRRSALHLPWTVRHLRRSEGHGEVPPQLTHGRHQHQRPHRTSAQRQTQLRTSQSQQGLLEKRPQSNPY